MPWVAGSIPRGTSLLLIGIVAFRQLLRQDRVRMPGTAHDTWFAMMLPKGKLMHRGKTLPCRQLLVVLTNEQRSDLIGLDAGSPKRRNTSVKKSVGRPVKDIQVSLQINRFDLSRGLKRGQHRMYMGEGPFGFSVCVCRVGCVWRMGPGTCARSSCCWAALA